MNAITRRVDAAAARPIDLPVIDARAALETRKLARLRDPLSLATGIGDVTLSLADPGLMRDWSGPLARIDLLCAERPATLWLPDDVLLASLQGAYPMLDDSALDAADRALLVDALENDLLDRLSQAVRAEISVVAVSRDVALDGMCDFVFAARVSGAETPLPAGLTCHALERERITAAFLATPIRRQPVDGLTTTIAFRCGRTSLSLSEFALLEPGCGITLDDTTLSFQKIVAVVAERFAQTCTWTTIKPVLDGLLLRPLDATTFLYSTDARVTDQSADPNQPARSGSVDEVPVQIVFELGRMETPLAELETLQAGYVFELGKPLGQSVDILANGKRVGTGELVRVGEAIGVRVSKLAR